MTYGGLAMARAERIRLRPRGPFSLALAGLGFGPRKAEPDARLMRLAFYVDGSREHAAVVVRGRSTPRLGGEADNCVSSPCGSASHVSGETSFAGTSERLRQG